MLKMAAALKMGVVEHPEEVDMDEDGSENFDEAMDTDDSDEVDADDRKMEGVNQERSINDPIHDNIPLPDYCWLIIDTPQFQRLRYIKQLGTSYYVWNGAAHNRFEHCIGVAHLARLMIEKLRASQPSLGITDRDVKCVILAALCHDLGHGPWSHVWDNSFIPVALPGAGWTHEQGSENMLDALVAENDTDLQPDEVDFIKDLIQGKVHHTRGRSPPEKAFLFEIVANKVNGLDVDKFDYLVRDNRGIGKSGDFSIQRLIDSARVIKNHICYNIKDANQIYEIFHMRFSNHKRIYNHKTAKAIEFMIIDALLAADPYLKIAERIRDTSQYVHLTDEIMGEIERSKAPELKESRDIFRRIHKRELYRCVGYKSIAWQDHKRVREHITREKILEETRQVCRDTSDLRYLEGVISPEDIIVDFAPIHYGMKAENPLSKVKFYAKHKPNRCSSAEKGDYSTLMPECFGEVILRIYTKNKVFHGAVFNGYKALTEKMEAGFERKGEPLLNPSGYARKPSSPPPQELPEERMTQPLGSPEPGPRNDSFVSTASTAVSGEGGTDTQFSPPNSQPPNSQPPSSQPQPHPSSSSSSESLPRVDASPKRIAPASAPPQTPGARTHARKTSTSETPLLNKFNNVPPTYPQSSKGVVTPTARRSSGAGNRKAPQPPASPTPADRQSKSLPGADSLMTLVGPGSAAGAGGAGARKRKAEDALGATAGKSLPAVVEEESNVAMKSAGPSSSTLAVPEAEPAPPNPRRSKRSRKDGGSDQGDSSHHVHVDHGSAGKGRGKGAASKT